MWKAIPTTTSPLIQVELKTTVKETDVEQCWDLLRRKVANAQAELPEGASPSIVKDDFGNVYGMFFALTGDGLSDRGTLRLFRINQT